MDDPVGVLFGGPSSEHDVSVITGLQAVHRLVDAGHAVVAIYWTKSGEFHEIDAGSESADLAEGPPSGSTPLELRVSDQPGFHRRGRFRSSPLALRAVVLACHGGAGEDGTLQGALDLAGVAYTGPTQASAQLSMDKLAFGTLVANAGLPTVPRVGYLATVDGPPPFPAPWIAKPRYGGSSLGTEVVEDLEALRSLVAHSVHMGQGCVVEPYLAGSADINIAVRMHPAPQVSAIERPVRSGPGQQVLGFRDKYTAGEGMVGAERELPAVLDDDVAEFVRSSALQVGALLPVRGVSRVDYLLTDDEVYVNELNAIPGSLAKYLWLDDGPDFTTMLTDMLDEAVRVRSYRPITAGADGQLLRDAGSIAAKLS